MSLPKSKPPDAGRAGRALDMTEDRRRILIESFLANGWNKTAAAITAGFSPKWAQSHASHLFNDPRVKAMIASRRAELMRITGLTTERTLREVARLAYSDIGRLTHEDGSLIALDELNDDVRASIASIEVDEEIVGKPGEDGTITRCRTTKIKLWDKNAALEKAMKHLGLFERDNRQRPGQNLAIQVVIGK